MEIPTDFKDAFYGHLRNDILSMLTGPLAGQNESEESALRKVRQHSGAERGYSDAYVKSLPEWQTRFGTAEPVIITAKTEENGPKTFTDADGNSSVPDEEMTPVPFQEEAKEKTPQVHQEPKKQ